MAKSKIPAQAVNPRVRVGVKKKKQQAAVAAVRSTVGTGPQEWTAAEMRALLVALLYESGGLDEDLRIRPLNEWIDR